jgi:hypothetical protein
MPLRRHACHRENTLQVFHHSTENFVSHALALQEDLYITSSSEKILIRVCRINYRRPPGCGLIAKSPDSVLSWLPEIIGERSADCQSSKMRVYDIFNRYKRSLILFRAANAGILERRPALS